MASTEQITGNIGLPQLSVSTDGGTIYTPIAEIVEPTPGAPVTDQYETTHADLTDNRKTFKPGWTDDGEASFVANYREDSYEQLLALVGVDAKWRLEWTDPGNTTTDPKLEWDGGIQNGPTPLMPLQDRWTLEFSIKVSSQVFTAGT